MALKGGLQPEKRKVQLTGTSTFTVSLPKGWAKKNGITAGVEVMLTESSDGGLLVRPGQVSTEMLSNTIHVDDKTGKNEILRTLLAQYLNGYEKLTIVSKGGFSEKLRSSITKHVNKLIGVEVVEEEEDKIVVQDFFSSDYLSIEKILRRAFNISLLMLKNVFSGQRDIKMDDLEREIDRLHVLIRRQLNLALKSSTKMHELKLTTSKCLAYMMIMEGVENIADRVLELSRFVAKMKLDAKTLRALRAAEKDIMDQYKDLVKAVFAEDEKIANNIINKWEARTTPLVSLAKQATGAKKPKTLHFSHVIFNLHGINKDMVEIAEALIDMCNSK